MRDEELQVSYWLVGSRPKLRKIALVTFILFDFLLFGFACLYGIRFLASSGSYEALIGSYAQNRVQYAKINSRLKPAVPIVSQTTVLGGTGGKYDLVAVVKNPSDRWALESVEYAFALDQQTLANGVTSFFPSEERYLVQFQVPLARVSPQAKMTVVFSNPRWRRAIDKTDLPAIDIRVQNPAFHILSTVPGNLLSQVTATMTNGSVFSLGSVDVTALLMNAGSIVGVGQITLSNINALESRPIDIRLYQILDVQSTLIKAAVDLSAFPISEEARR